MVGIRWCVVGTARLQLIVHQLSPTLLTLFPPPCSGAPPPSHTSSLITVLFVTWHSATPEVFHKSFLWYKLLALICIITLPFVFSLGMAFRTFTQHIVAKKCTLSLPDKNFWEILFPLFYYCLRLNTFMPITYFEGIKRPLILMEHSPWLL
jgi:hypothetical protein